MEYYCSEHKEATCKSHPCCKGCNALAWRVYDREAWIKFTKENNMKNYGNAKIIIGNLVYPATSVNYEQTVGEYPQIEVEANLNPFTASMLSSIHPKQPSIKNVIFNPPATIIFWSDNTKTVVKCDFEQEPYDPEKGIAMAIARKMLGDNKYDYYNIFLHWLKKWNKQKIDLLDKCKTPTPTESEWNGDMSDA